MVENEIREEPGLSLLDIWNILIKNLIIIIACTFFGGACGGVYGYVIKDPTYVSNASVMIQVKIENDTNVDVNNGIVVGLRITQTVAELMQSNLVCKLTAAEVYGDENYYSRIKSGLSITATSNSLMLPISYVSTDRENVKKVLDSVINNTIALANDDNNNFVALKDKIAVVDTASAPKYNSPNKMLLLIIGVVLGGVLGVVIAFIKELLNDKIADQNMIEDKLGIKCIGVITDIHSQGGKK